ncbi:MAG TPA: glycosyltransferase [Stellaceae bacterium]|jgi:glycosyltransferase involved in cell wall biosynthesis|nr:glycosyltransferase [Stellaceae bacterium]
MARAAGVSFVITVYNKAIFLPLVVEALFAQGGDFEREFIFIDDGSTDQSWELLQRLTERRADVRLLQQANAGPAIATNVAVRAARLPWLKIVDADDVLAPACTQLLLDGAMRLGLPLARGHMIDYRLGEPVDFGDADTSEIEFRRQNLFRDCLKNVPCNLSPLLIDRALYWRVGGCDERLFTQDYSLLLRLTWQSAVAEVGPMPLAASPIEAPNRVSDNQRRMLRDTNQAILLFLSETQGLPWRYRREATERAFGRAWKWQRRKLGAGLSSRWFRLYALAQLAPPSLMCRSLASTLSAFGEPP